MAWSDEGINTYVRDLIRPKLNSTFTKAKPLLAWLIGSAGTGKDSLGDPNVGAFFGGETIGMGERAVINGSLTHKFRYQSGQTDSAEVRGSDDSDTPTAGSFAEDNTGTAGVNWTHFWNPIKVREDSVLNAQNGGMSGEMTRLKIASVIEEAVGMGFQRQLEKQQSKLWSGTLSSAQQSHSTQTWADYIGVTHWVSDGASTGETGYATVGGVDRTVETELKAFSPYTTAGHSAATISARKLRQFRLGIFNSYTAGPYTDGPRSRWNNAGSLVITTPTLWETIADDVTNSTSSTRNVDANNIPQFAKAGFTNPVVMVDDMTVVFDWDCPANHVFWLTPETWTYEIQKGANFMIEPWQKKWLNEEGGAYYRWTQVHHKARLTCRRPDLNVKWILS